MKILIKLEKKRRKKVTVFLKKYRRLKTTTVKPRTIKIKSIRNEEEEKLNQK